MTLILFKLCFNYQILKKKLLFFYYNDKKIVFYIKKNQIINMKKVKFFWQDQSKSKIIIDSVDGFYHQILTYLFFVIVNNIRLFKCINISKLFI